MGHDCCHEATVHYEYERACGDGWNEPHYPENVTLCAVEAQIAGKTVDLYPLLSKEQIAAIEADLLQQVADECDYRKSEAADARRDEMRSMA
jgi:hypothetical protein